MKILHIAAFLCITATLSAQVPPETNYDEAKVPTYVLPDPLHCEDGTPVTAVDIWEAKRRPEILELYRSQVYGRAPEGTVGLKAQLLAEDITMEGRAWRRQVKLTLSREGRSQDLLLLMYLPTARPAPVFLTYNFYGNQTLRDDPAILPTTSWCRNNEKHGVTNHDGSKAIYGSDSTRWALDDIIDAGFGLVTACYNDIYPDGPGNEAISAKHLFDEEVRSDSWGSIAVWAWGLSRIMDYLEEVPEVDASRVAVMGHSRQGKAALWAGAEDQRFAIVISNDSGSSGAALYRRQFGETAELMMRPVPYWMCDNFHRYRNNEAALPVDQHQLLALMAPRPVYVASAVEDLWADPKGEFLALYHADPVYHLYGFRGMEIGEQPEVDTPIHNRTGYHMRSGDHDVKRYDWLQYIAFAREWFFNGE